MWYMMFWCVVDLLDVGFGVVCVVGEFVVFV